MLAVALAVALAYRARGPQGEKPGSGSTPAVGARSGSDRADPSSATTKHNKVPIMSTRLLRKQGAGFPTGVEG